MSTDSDLTILLTLKNRALFAFRWMRYANAVRFPYKVLIADGGADERVSEILANRPNFPNVNYEYIRYPYDQTYAHYYAKLVDALARVETPFVVMADNDDFFVVDGLTRSVEFLRNHPDYSSCRGIIGGARIEPNVRYGELSQVYGSQPDIFFVAQIYPPGSTLDDTAAQRVQNQFSCYRSNWYDVFRTEQARASYQVLKELNIRDLILAQHIPHLLGNVAGKVHRDSYLYLVRQMDGPDSSDRTETRGKGDHFDRMLLETWSEDFTGFVNAIATAVSEKDGIPVDEARRLVRQGYRTFMAPYIVGCLAGELPPTHPVRAARNIVSNLGPAGRALRRLYGVIRTLIDGRSFARQYAPGQRFVATHSGFKTIYEFLISPPFSSGFPHQMQPRDNRGDLS